MAKRINVGEFLDQDTLTPDRIEEKILENQMGSREVSAEQYRENLFRSIDIALSMEAIRESIATAGTLSDTERQYIRIAAEMAVSGTGINPLLVIPELPTLAIEADAALSGSIGEAIGKIGQHIQKLVHRFKDKLEENTFKQAKLSEQLKLLTATIQKTKDSAVNDRVDVSLPDHSIFHLGQQDKTLTSLSDLQKAFKEATSMYGKVMEIVTSKARAYGEQQEAIINADNVDEIKDVMFKIFDKLSGAAEDISKLNGFNQTKKTENLFLFESPVSLCSFFISLAHPNLPELDLHDKKSIKARGLVFDFDVLVKNKVVLKKEITLKGVTLKEVENFVDVLKEAYDGIDLMIPKLRKMYQSLPKQVYDVSKKKYDTDIPDLNFYILYTYKLFLVNIYFIEDALDKSINVTDHYIMLMADRLRKIAADFAWQKKY